MEKEGSALYLCPGCGAFVSESASKCPKCGEILESGPVDEPVAADSQIAGSAEMVAEVELAILEDSRTADDDSEPVTLYLCTECGAFTGSDAKACPNCGASMEADEEAEEQGPAIKPEEPEANIFDMLVPAQELPEEDILENLKKLESAEDVESFLESMSEDSVDDEPLAPPELLPERSEESDDILSWLVHEKDGVPAEKETARTDALQDVEDILDNEPARYMTTDCETIALCRNCGAFVSESARTCNVCGNALAGGERIVAHPGAEAKKVEATDEEADTLMRKLLGVADDAELDPGAGSRFQSDGSLGLCTVCGAFISADSPSCPICGTHMEDMPEFVPSVDIVEPEKEMHGLAICPHCGVFVQEGARECLSCVKEIPDGATVPVSASMEETDDPDKAVNLLKSLLGIKRALDMTPIAERPFTGLDLCPDCGAFVSMSAVICPVCSAPLFEDASDIQDIDREISALDNITCPHCNSAMPPGSESCPECGLSFSEPQTPAEKPLEEDISRILDIELDAMEEVALPPVDHAQALPEDIIDQLVLDEHIVGHDDLPGSEAPTIESHEEESIPEPEPEATGPTEEAPAAPETLEFIGPEALDAFDEEARHDDVMQEGAVLSKAEPASLPKVEMGKHSAMHAANWAIGVYVSVATICFFLFFHTLAPGDYAPGLAIIFGTLVLIGAYLLATERAMFFKGDLRSSGVFITGFIIATAVLLHRPLGITGLGTGQPALDHILLSVSILLTSIGLLWIRARVKFAFTWFFGNLLLFMCALVSFMHSNFGSGLESPVLTVAALGSSMIFLSMIFLQYERAIDSSIETDIVRGDAHYLKRDYASALASYDHALAKAQMKKAESMLSPIVHYDVPWYSKGSALIFMGEFEEGIKCLDMALAINPNNEVTWVNKGNAHSKLGQHELAAECYAKAIECNPFYEIAWNNLGNVHARRMDYIGALRHYNRAIKINPRYDDAWINKGYVLAKMGKREQAVKCLNHVGSRAKGKPRAIEKDVHAL